MKYCCWMSPHNMIFGNNITQKAGWSFIISDILILHMDKAENNPDKINKPLANVNKLSARGLGNQNDVKNNINELSFS